MLLRNAAKVFPEEGYAVVGPRLQALASEGDTDFKVLHSALCCTVQYWHLAEGLCNPVHPSVIHAMLAPMARALLPIPSPGEAEASRSADSQLLL